MHGSYYIGGANDRFIGNEPADDAPVLAELRSVLFNGTNHIATLPAAQTVLGNATISEFTVAFWMKYAVATANQYKGMWNWTTNSAWADGAMSYFLTTGSSPQYAFAVNNWSANRSYDIDVAAQWNFVVQRYKSGMTNGLNCSINDSAPVTLASLTANVTAMSNPIIIGSMPGSATYFSNAYFCCFGFWDRYISDAEKTALYNGGVFAEFTTVPTNLQGYFRTDADTDVVNSGGWVDYANSNNGTFSNSPTLSTDVPPLS